MIPTSTRESVVKEVIETDSSYSEIREKYGISKGTLWNILKERGLTRVRKPLVPQDVIGSALSEVVKSRKTLVQIAEEFGIHLSTLERYMRQNGIRRT